MRNINHDLRITSALTGAHRVVCKPERADGFDYEDFDACLDAPDFVASGSTRRFEYKSLGVLHISSIAFVLRPS